MSTLELNIVTLSNEPLGKIYVPSTGSVTDIKAEVEKLHEKLNGDRQAIRLTVRGRNESNKLTLQELKLRNGSKIYIKDLGPQISWSAVFLLEYIGPLILYLSVMTRPWILYGSDGGNTHGYSMTTWIAAVCWTLHYAKRIYETLFVHIFSNGTMPMTNLFKNCGYYWGFSLFVAYYLNHPLYTEPMGLITLMGLAGFIFCEAGNFSIHILLRELRPKGSTARKIPMPNKLPLTGLYNFVSCPNYTYEYGAWLSFAFMTLCLPAFLFALVGMMQMSIWALKKHKAYKQQFPKYPKDRMAILPFVL